MPEKFTCHLTGDNESPIVPDLELRFSSFSAYLTAASVSIQVVLPGLDQLPDINARSNGEIVILYNDVELARALRIDQDFTIGPVNRSVTIDGRTDGPAYSPATVALERVAVYASTYFTISRPVPEIVPGGTVTYDEGEYLVKKVSMNISDTWTVTIGV